MSGSTSGIVAFSYSEWAALFPEFAGVSAGQAQLYFNLAQRYCDNTVSSPVVDYSAGGERDTYLNLLTAHIAALLGGVAGQPASQIVGRIGSATEGSVSVSAEMPLAGSANEAFFMQTKYGFMFWTATSQYRLRGVTVGRVFGTLPITGPFPGAVEIPLPFWAGFGDGY